mgnify:CR=1 FL=1
MVRIWDRKAAACLAILQQHASDMQALSLTSDGSLLAAIGKDARGRQLLAVWDVRGAAKEARKFGTAHHTRPYYLPHSISPFRSQPYALSPLPSQPPRLNLGMSCAHPFAQVPSCQLLDAKVSLHHIRKLTWVPPCAKSSGAPLTTSAEEEVQLISCGFENVRFWWLRRGKLHACGTALQHHEGQMFLDMAIDSSSSGGGGVPGDQQRRMLVSAPVLRTVYHFRHLHCTDTLVTPYRVCAHPVGDHPPCALSAPPSMFLSSLSLGTPVRANAVCTTST